MSQYDDLVNRFAELGARIMVLENVVKNLSEGLKDIKDHSGIPTFSGIKWSNYCHVIADDLIKKAEEVLSETKTKKAS